jgi:hypothetical protein
MALLDSTGKAIKPTQTRVVICVPTRGECKRGFVSDLLQLVNLTARARPDIILGFQFGTGTLLHDLRSQIARDALKLEPDYLFWLDDDVRFPADALIHLLDRKKDIVGANYTTRRFPQKPTAKIVHQNGIQFWDIPTKPDSTGLQEVSALGFGCILIRADVFRKLEKDHETTGHPPWFSMPYSKEYKNHVSEDVYMLTMARGAGFQVFLDHDLSKHILHIGEWEYAWEHLWSMEPDEEKSAA